MKAYPLNDEQFEETHIVKAEKTGEGWQIERADGWSFFVPAESPVDPIPGMIARFYGKGIGYTVRGLFLDGQRVYYRTEAEDAEHQEIQLYGANAADWLAKWDRGETVWTIEMGGLGPGYEQAIQITVAELLRIMLAGDYHPDLWEDGETHKREIEHIREQSYKAETITKLGISGAQFGAALNVAAFMLRKGPQALMKEVENDRRIMVSKNWPSAA